MTKPREELTFLWALLLDVDDLLEEPDDGDELADVWIPGVEWRRLVSAARREDRRTDTGRRVGDSQIALERERDHALQLVQRLETQLAQQQEQMKRLTSLACMAPQPEEDGECGLPADQACGAPGRCERPKGHRGTHQTREYFERWAAVPPPRAKPQRQRKPKPEGELDAVKRVVEGAGGEFVTDALPPEDPVPGGLFSGGGQ